MKNMLLEIRQQLMALEKKLFTGQPVRSADIGRLLSQVDEVLALSEGDTE